MSAAVLEIENLSKSFGGVHAVRDCSFAVAQGQVLGLIGPNGAGKSTVVDLVSGFGRPDSGSVLLAGQELVGKRPDVISRLGLIRTFQTPREWRGLTDLRNASAGTLSGGQKRLLEFARIAAAQPRLIILDEPMGGVNPVLGAQIRDAVRQFAAAGQAVIVVEHNLPFIEKTCDEVVVMDLGEVIAQGAFAGLRGNPRVVDAYLGMDMSHD